MKRSFVSLFFPFLIILLTFSMFIPPMLTVQAQGGGSTTTLAAAPAAPAATTSAAPTTTLQNPLGTPDLRVFIGNIIKAALGLAGSLALLMFVWGGVQWLISGGKPEMIKKGKDTLIWAVLGIVVIFTAYTLVNVLVKALASGQVG